QGFASLCGLVECDWEGAEASEQLPARFVVKIPSALPFRKLNDSLPAGQRMLNGDEAMWEMMEGKLREVHDVEVATYEFFESFDGLEIPKMYYGIPYGKEDSTCGQIALEFVENSRMMNFHENHSVEQVRQVARALGKIQACSLKKEPTAVELQKNFFEDFAKTITMEAWCGMYKAVTFLDSSEETAVLSAKIDHLLPDYYASSLPTTIHKQFGIRPVLVNGDLRTENVLIDCETGNLASLIDWQCTHLGVAVEDLIRISLFALTPEERRASAPMLIAEMYNSLVANLGGDEPPYTLEMCFTHSMYIDIQLRELYDLLFPHLGLYFAGGCIMMI
ncbi:hypothetical protein PFISCL1PPCAC_21124, partial [Pristionchus fissidentatus]